MPGPLHRIDQRVGPFQLVEWLGTSGGVSLYRGVRPAESRRPREVAVRIADDPQDRRAANRLQDEHELLRQLDDPRIPRVYGHYTAMNAIALTWIEGVTLDDVVQAHNDGHVALDPATAVDVVIEVAHALRHAHAIVRTEGPILHGHLSPQQVRLTRGGNVFVVGFGDPEMPRSGYAAPEQVAGAFVDPRTDQWALGALALELLTGHALRAAAVDEAALAGELARRLNPVAARWPTVAWVLGTMLAPAAGDRFDKDPEMIRQLLSAARTVEGTTDRASLAARVQAVADRLAAERPPRAPLEVLSRAPALTPVAPPARPVRLESPAQPAAPEPPAHAPAQVALFDPPRTSGPTLVALADVPVVEDSDDVIVEFPTSDPHPAFATVEVTADGNTMDSAGATVPYPIDPASRTASSSLPPVPRFQLSEILGIALGILLVVLGMIYLSVNLW